MNYIAHKVVTHQWSIKRIREIHFTAFDGWYTAQKGWQFSYRDNEMKPWRLNRSSAPSQVGHPKNATFFGSIINDRGWRNFSKGIFSLELLPGNDFFVQRSLSIFFLHRFAPNCFSWWVAFKNIFPWRRASIFFSISYTPKIINGRPLSFL